MTLYVSDLDGTLLGSDAALSDKSIGCLNALLEQGTLFTYATARSFASAFPLVSKLELRCPAVTNNGVFIVDPKTGEHIIENFFTLSAVRAAWEYLAARSLSPLVYSYINGAERVSYLAHGLDAVRSYVASRKGDRRLRPCVNYAELFEGKVFYITLFDPPVPTEELNKTFGAESGFSVNCQYDTYDDRLWYEIFRRGVSKANAVLRVKELVKADKLVCFGDNENDVSMINLADIGVAVSNACAGLKNSADVIIGSNDSGAVAEFIAERERASSAADRFSSAVSSAMVRIRGMHGSVGTQNEKLIHASLKNYYAPYSDEQEIKIGNFFADAVNENGIFEIQTRSLKKLSEKLRVFLRACRVTVVYPVEAELRTVYIDRGTGEVVKQTPWRKYDPRVKTFAELYSLREFLKDPKLTVIIAKLRVEKHVRYSGEKPPDLRNRRVRRGLDIEKIPLKLLEEIELSRPEDYLRFLPGGLPEQYVKKEFLKAAKESAASLRLEVLREAGVIRRIGKRGSSYLYQTDLPEDKAL